MGFSPKSFSLFVQKIAQTRYKFAAKYEANNDFPPPK